MRSQYGRHVLSELKQDSLHSRLHLLMPTGVCTQRIPSELLFFEHSKRNGKTPCSLLLSMLSASFARKDSARFGVLSFNIA